MASREVVRLRRGYRVQRGFAAIAVLTLLIVSSLYSITARLNLAASSTPHLRQVHTVDVLNRAKAALVAFAADNSNRPGGLPCPDRDGDGEAELSCDRPEQRTGWYPWQTLKTGELRDASGAKLWYALAGSFRNDPDVAINSLSAGELAIVRRDAGATQRVASDLVAVVIGPGAPLPGQSRSGASTARVDAWLEGENAKNGTTAFEAGTLGATFNDTVLGLSQAELFDVVDRIVATRIRREIAPLLRAQVFDAWQALPFAVPFEAPRRSRYKDTALADRTEGLIPATNDPTWVHWDTASIRVDHDPAIAQINCGASTPAELRCDVIHAGSAPVRLSARARNVGRALVRPISADDADFGPGTLVARRVSNGAVDAAGGATISASATLPAMAGRTRITLRAPQPVPALTDSRIPVAAAHSWFARNRWHQLLYYAAAPAALPGGQATNCESQHATCLALEDRDHKRAKAAALLVFMGRPYGDRAVAHPDAVSSYLEGDNAIAGDGSYRDGVPSAQFNDSVIVVCASTEGGCK